jgi:hypothetical protein
MARAMFIATTGGRRYLARETALPDSIRSPQPESRSIR